MQYFSLHHTEKNRHAGFLIMVPDNEREKIPQSGTLAVKIAEIAPPQAVECLKEWVDYGSLTWSREQDRIIVRNKTGLPVGSIKQQYLTIGTQEFLLSNLTGVL